MSIAKFKVFNSPDVMKTEVGNDSLDSIIRQAMGKEPVLSFSRPGDSPVQWIQYLHTELPGWPFFPPVKMQKCDKCSREFCSTINYRRHIRAYHRLKRLEKDFTKNRELLAAFWDKLSSEEAKEVVSFKNDLFEEVSGSAIIKSLTALIRKPSGLPLAYLKTGSVLLDIVQGRPSRFPIFSRELFGILDDASEKTFLCCTAASMQKYIFDGEAAKICLETKNLVAYMSFLVEKRLVKAWLADKDAEALRCHKLLVEEEEAAQKRQAELLERKRQKKLRQKEQKAKEQGLEEYVDDEGADQMSDIVPSVDLSNPIVDCNMETHDPEILPDHFPPSFEAFQQSNAPENKDSKTPMEFSSYPELNIDLNNEQKKTQKSGHKQLNSRWHLLPKSQGLPSNSFHSDQNFQASKILVVQNHGCSAPSVNGNKVWSRKPKLENNGDRCKVTVQKEEATNRADQPKCHVVLIGSISTTLGNCSNEDEKSTIQEKALKCNSTTSGTNNVTGKLWRPVSRNCSKRPDQVQNIDGEREVDLIASKGNDQILHGECKVTVQKEEATNRADQPKCHEVWIGSISMTLGNCSNEDEKLTIQDGALKCDSTTSGTNNVTGKLCSPVSRNSSKRPDQVQNVDGEREVDLIASKGNDQILHDENNKGICGNSSLAERSILPANGLPFSSDTAKAFLAQRWKEAMMAEHVKLVLLPIKEPQDCEFTSQLPKLNKSNDVAREEKHSKILGSRTAGVTKHKFRAKAEKNMKIKYIPKQRSHCE